MRSGLTFPDVRLESDHPAGQLEAEKCSNSKQNCFSLFDAASMKCRNDANFNHDFIFFNFDFLQDHSKYVPHATGFFLSFWAAEGVKHDTDERHGGAFCLFFGL